MSTSYAGFYDMYIMYIMYIHTALVHGAGQSFPLQVCVCSLLMNTCGSMQGSRGVSHPAHTYNLFLTAAPVDGIKLWDLRTNR